MTLPDSEGSSDAARPRKAKVFRDPVHDLIYFTPEDRWLVDLIETKEFQRLRRIRQLGLAHLVYPGAEHSRFVHSMGVFDVARRMIRKLRHRHDADSTIESELEEKANTIKVAALVHDLGHGPFSHVFERAFRDADPPMRKHADWSCHLIRDIETEIGGRLSQHNAQVNVDEVCRLISDGELPPNPFYLRDIVSSQLDADRMDYLLRDSLMTGSRYGQFDSEWILNALMIAEPRIGRRSEKKLCLDASKGTGGIEGFLFARLQMLQYVYGHKTTRAYEAELVQTLRLALRLRDDIPADTPEPVRVLLQKLGSVSPKEYLALDDEVVWWALRRWATWERPPERESGFLARALQSHSLRLVRRHRPWKHIEVQEGEARFNVVALHEELVRADNPLQYECFVDTLDDLPYKSYRYLARRASTPSRGREGDFLNEIYVVEDGEPKRLGSTVTTPVFKGLSEPFELCRFYFNRTLETDFTGLFSRFGVC